jgi:hypothetical protein
MERATQSTLRKKMAQLNIHTEKTRLENSPQMVKKCTMYSGSSSINSTGPNFSTTLPTINPDSMSKVLMSIEQSNPLSLN